MRVTVPRLAAFLAAFALAACGGGGGGGSSTTPTPTTPPPPQGVYTLPSPEALTAADVQKILAQSIAEAKARNLPSVIAVTDRVGNVLAIYTMAGARATTLTRPGPTGVNTDVQGLNVPAAAAAIAKAITGAYLSSSGGNSFSTRTASQIVQEHFPPSPSAVGLEGGPLFGVQFSQLPCSDVVTRIANQPVGPRRSPLGLSADPGGFPLYKNGVLVGGIGVVGDGDYGFDRNILDVEDDAEENIALAGTIGFDAPEEQRADRITVDGTALRYSDATPGSLKSTPASAPAFTSLPAGTGSFTPVTGYYSGAGALAGVAYGTEASGLRLATTAEFSIPSAMVLTNGSGQDRFPIRGGTDAADGLQPLSAQEVTALMEEAFTIMSRARGQIRRPLDSRAQVSITVVDSRGQILGLVRAPDAPIFGIDVSAQKARTVALLSGLKADDLNADPDGDVRTFLPAARAFFPDPAAFTGKTAFAAKSIGNLSRPYFPDGEVGRPNGPFSRPITLWSPLSTGLQSALIVQNLLQHVGFVTGAAPNDTPAVCTNLPQVAPGQNRLQNGMQIFSGAVPVYRGTRLVGAIGVSGDGIDQDDMISFLGANNAGVRVGGAIGNAAPSMRADQLLVGPTQTRLRYVGCPFAPFLDTSEQNVCQGK